MLFLGYNGIKIKIVTIFVPTKNVAGCSSARLEYTSGGRVVASSNLVIPTMLSNECPQSQDWGFFIVSTLDARIKRVEIIKNIHNCG